MDLRQVYICDDTVTGIFSAIYEGWKAYTNAEVGIAIKGYVTPELFCEYKEVKGTERKSIAVERLIKNHLGQDAYWSIYHALLSDDPQKGDIVYQMMRASRGIRNQRRIIEHLGNPYVVKVFELSRKVSNEAHCFQGFVRFQELENGVLLSKIAPKTQILSCIGEHFAKRLSLENWMIYDTTHEMFLIHIVGKQWVLMNGEELTLQEDYRSSVSEKEFEGLWKGFCQCISIKERENLKSQRAHLPQRFRQNMTEF